MSAATLDGRAFEPPPLRPPWLRPLVIAIVIALHAAALSIVYLEPPKPLESPREVIVDIEPEATPAEAPAPPAEAPKQTEKSAPAPPQDIAPAPVEPAPAPPPPVVEEPAPPPAAEQPPLEAQPPLPPVEAPPRPPAPVELAPPKPPPPRRIEPRPKAERVRQRPETKERKRAPDSQRTTASRETGRPEASRSAPASAASQSAYISEISGAIRSRLFYPSAARARGARGVVGVAFTIGASGAVTSFSITRSSGDRDLDAAARELVHSVRFPPPPGGSAHVATSFNYAPR